MLNQIVVDFNNEAPIPTHLLRNDVRHATMTGGSAPFSAPNNLNFSKERTEQELRNFA